MGTSGDSIKCMEWAARTANLLDKLRKNLTLGSTPRFPQFPLV